MAKKRAGWERVLKYGAAGAAASTIVETATDVDLDTGPGFESTITRGDGSALPKETEQPVSLSSSPSFKFRYKDGDATQAALIAAARTGAAVAILILRMLGGETEFDGDCYLEMSSPGPLTGGMEVSVTCHPTDDEGRAWTVG